MKPSILLFVTAIFLLLPGYLVYGARQVIALDAPSFNYPIGFPTKLNVYTDQIVVRLTPDTKAQDADAILQGLESTYGASVLRRNIGTTSPASSPSYLLQLPSGSFSE